MILFFSGLVLKKGLIFAKTAQFGLLVPKIRQGNVVCVHYSKAGTSKPNVCICSAIKRDSYYMFCIDVNVLYPGENVIIML
jgi:hypothetical protein